MLKLAAVFMVFAIAGCQQSAQEAPPEETPAAATESAEEMEAPASGIPSVEFEGEEKAMAGGLKMQDIHVGDGAVAEKGMTASMHYTGWLPDGTKFDSSHDRGTPFPFTIGTGGVIKGWDEGVPGMRVGGKRRLTIPPDMAYGERGYPPVIPPNSTLVFDVELVGLK
jgi:FKBP-type peptidyl-prolyl cis-trans isomerase FkpA